MTQRVIDCGVIQIKGNPEDYERVKNSALGFQFSICLLFWGLLVSIFNV